MVSVPVLSITRASTFLISSNAVASLMSMFCRAALPIPTIRAVGVASPIAQGQAMTKTATADNNACGSTSVPPAINQMTKVSTLMATTVGTKIRAILSTTRWTGAFEPCASCTIWMIWASIVFCPTSCAFRRRAVIPSVLSGLVTIVPA